MPVVPWVISAKSAGGLRAQAARLAGWAQQAGPDVRLVGAGLVRSRAVLDYRAVVVGPDRDTLIDRLREVTATSPASAGKTVLLFSGQGSQRVGMGQQLAAAFPVFAAVWEEAWELLGGEVMPESVEQTGWAQPALFAFEVALFRLLQSWGVRPDLLIGHSVGEVAAAHVAGVLSLADACRLVAARARLMQALPSGGAMLRVPLSEAEVLARGWDVDVAAVNGPGSVVLSGPRSVLERVERSAGVGCGWLRVSHGFHSVLMEPMLAEFAAVLDGLSWSAPRIAVVSTLTGQVSDDIAAPGYWCAQARRTVRFADAVRTAAQLGGTRFAEVGPGSALTVMTADCLSGLPATALVPARASEPQEVLTGLGELFTAGATVDWPALFDAVPATRV
ncbi:acyltransferase domain-containing protein, partial [Micromonospora arborensis]|uniref:acyltransferase domain-containing protein n=1 Tax=Micromonospora arborensis TaxID=2116518 RepID=UPI0033C83891